MSDEAITPADALAAWKAEYRRVNGQELHATYDRGWFRSQWMTPLRKREVLLATMRLAGRPDAPEATP